MEKLGPNILPYLISAEHSAFLQLHEVKFGGTLVANRFISHCQELATFGDHPFVGLVINLAHKAGTNDAQMHLIMNAFHRSVTNPELDPISALRKTTYVASANAPEPLKTLALKDFAHFCGESMKLYDEVPFVQQSYDEMLDFCKTQGEQSEMFLIANGAKLLAREVGAFDPPPLLEPSRRFADDFAGTPHPPAMRLS